MAVVSPTTPSTQESTVPDDTEKLDQLELEAALSAACHSPESTEVKDNLVVLHDGTFEALYNSGGTPLFSHLELCEWQEAFDLCTPESLRTWVKSTGTTNTTFGWALWRRLPIHEAARRQAPAWLLVKMLSLYPESASQTTQFGELPLHVAVETGSTPEVIHLLLIAFMEGVDWKDKSGRTPLEVCKENEYPDPVVLESLERATSNHLRLMQGWQNKTKALQEDHERAMQELEDQHLEQLRVECERQQQLEKALAEGHVSVEQMLIQEQMAKTMAHESEQETSSWKAQALALKEKVVALQQENADQGARIEHLEQELKERDESIETLNECIDTLSDDLTNSLVFHRDHVLKSMAKANNDLKIMMKSQRALQGHLTGHARGMEMLLERRGIEVPPPPQPPKKEVVPVVDTSAAVRVASKVASKALEVSNAKEGYV